MERVNRLLDFRRSIAYFLLSAGAAMILFSLGVNYLGVGVHPGFGPNQLAFAASGFGLFVSGAWVHSGELWRARWTWLFLAASAFVVAFCADFITINGGLPGVPAKILMIASMLAGAIVVASFEKSESALTWLDWKSLVPFDLLTAGKFLSILTQLSLLVLLIQVFGIENRTFSHNLMLMIFFGFTVQYFLPQQFRLAYFFFLSIFAILGVLGFVNGAWLLFLGLILIGLCHVPIALSIRLGLILVFGALLALFRGQLLPVPVPNAIWPILGSMFMFRLIIYLYHLRNKKLPMQPLTTLSYFFMLPNVLFPFFPVVDYRLFHQKYFDEDRHEIYQSGVRWIFRGVTQLIIYRLVNYYLIISPDSIANVTDLVQFIITNFLLYLRVSGQFHLIVGLLHLFGFNLPRTHNLYLLASSITDYWRRINIYWKEFMTWIFYYPAYFRLRRFDNTARLVLATLITFVITWFLHAYQWFWLRGNFPVTVQDISYWGILALLVIGNSLYEIKGGRRAPAGGKENRESLKATVRLAVSVTLTFIVTTTLWSIWTSATIGDWFSLWSVIGESLLGPIQLILSFVAIVGVFLTYFLIRNWAKRLSDRLPEPSDSTRFFRPALANVGLIVVLYLAGTPAIYNQFGPQVSGVIADLQATRLSNQDAALLVQGYYEDLLGVDRFNSELWELYMQIPPDWDNLRATDAARSTGDFMKAELVPNAAITFKTAQLHTNQWGMRDKPYELTPAEGTFRIALIGSSRTMGSGVGDGETFESLVEDRLNRELTGKGYSNYEILNFAVGGYTPLHQVAVCEERVFPFNPNALYYVSNQKEGERAIQHLIESVRSGTPPPYEYLTQLIEKTGINADMPQVEAIQRLSPFKEEIVAWVYHEIGEVAMQHRARLVWVYIPTLEGEATEAEVARLFSIAEEAGFDIVDLTDVFTGEEQASIVVAPWDLHPNVKGHQLIAEALYEALMARPEFLTPVTQTPSS